MELPADDLGPTIYGKANVVSLTHQAVPDLKTPAKKRLDTLALDEFFGTVLKNFVTWIW